MTTPSDLGAGTGRSRFGARVGLVLLLVVVVALVGYAVVRSFGTDDRAADAAARRDPMAEFVPPGATMTDEVVQPSGGLTTSHTTRIIRTFAVPKGRSAAALAATLNAARAAGWTLKQGAHGNSYGDRPGVPGSSLVVTLSDAQATAASATMFVTVEAGVV